MTKLNATAKAELRAAAVSQADWARHWFPLNARPGDRSTEIGRPIWLGDACGCPDDRCIGYHHDGEDDCGCLPVVLEGYLSRRPEAGR